MNDYINDISSLLSEGTITANALLREYTTFRVGGPAKLLVKLADATELSTIVGYLNKHKIEYMIIGNGSNLLVSDKGYDGVVLHMVKKLADVHVADDYIEAGAGAMLSFVCSLARDNELSGMEFAYGIPGTVGGAMVMNAGAYGKEMRDVVDSVWVLDSVGNERILTNSEMNFAYRHSIISDQKLIVTKARFKLNHGNKDEISQTMQELMEKRLSKQPLEYPSAGSTFKRPEGYFAGKLIEDAGLKGTRIGGATVSDKHCGFIVNDRKGCAKDIDTLIRLVTDKVEASFGVRLEPEVIRVGNFD